MNTKDAEQEQPNVSNRTVYLTTQACARMPKWHSEAKRPEVLPAVHTAASLQTTHPLTQL